LGTSNYLLNGKNTKPDLSAGTHSTWEIEAGKKYLFRFLNSAAQSGWRVAIDNHKMTVIGMYLSLDQTLKPKLIDWSSQPPILFPSNHMRLTLLISPLVSVTMSSSRQISPLTLTSSVPPLRVLVHQLATTLPSALPTVSSNTVVLPMLSQPRLPASHLVTLQVSARMSLSRASSLSLLFLLVLPVLSPLKLLLSQLVSLAPLPPLTMALSSAGT
jgi:Multicopper oxidase